MDMHNNEDIEKISFKSLEIREKSQQKVTKLKNYFQGYFIIWLTLCSIFLRCEPDF
jgi:hypothetical protein